MMNPFRRLPIVRFGAAAAMIAIAGAGAARADAVVATINGEPVTETDIEIAIADLDQQFAQLPEDQRRAAALSAIIEIRLMAAAAEAEGLAEGDEFNRRMALLRQRALHSAYIDQEVSGRVTDEAVRARYDEQVSQMEPAEEVRARHIIVESEEEAAAIIEELDAGGDFEEIAKEKSTDGAASQGGDLGWFGPGRMVPQFEEAAFAMEPGTHSSAPVQTQFGWHVIKVEEKRSQEPPAYEQVEQQFRSLLLREAYFEAVEAIRADAEVEIADETLREALEPAEADADADADGETAE